MQADNRRDLAKVFQGNRGDAGDLYPHASGLATKRVIGRTTLPPLNLPSGTWSGLTIRVRGTPGGDTMTIDVTVA